MTNPNPPTARQGIKASMTSEQLAAVKHDAKKAQETAAEHNPISTEGATQDQASSGINPPASQTPVDDETSPSEQPFGEEVFLDGIDLVCSRPQRVAFLVEALAGYRNMLVGLRKRLELEIENPPSVLNPAGAISSSKASLATVRLGIAKANVLLSELEPTIEQGPRP